MYISVLCMLELALHYWPKYYPQCHARTQNKATQWTINEQMISDATTLLLYIPRGQDIISDFAI